MPATGSDVPQELFQNVLFYAADPAPFRKSDLATAALVCLHWAKVCRPALWSGTLRINSVEKARWFKWLATTEGSGRLIPVVELVRSVIVVLDHPLEKSWLYLLVVDSTWRKLRQLTIQSNDEVAVYKARQYPAIQSPHWGLGKMLPPHFTPYREITLRWLRFSTPDDIFRFLSCFTRATEFKLINLVCDTDGPLTPRQRSASRHQSLQRVYGGSRHSSYNPTKLNFTRLCLEAFKLNRTLHICRSSYEEQAAVEELIDRVREAVFASSLTDLELRPIDNGFEALTRANVSSSLRLRFLYTPGTSQEQQTSLDSVTLIIRQNHVGLRKLTRALESSLVKLLPLRALVIASADYESLQTLVGGTSQLRSVADERSLHLRLACGRSGPLPLNEALDRTGVLESKKSDVWIGIDVASLEPNGQVWSTEELVPSRDA